MAARTDLALEAKALWERSAGKTSALPGVKARSETRDGTRLETVEILNEEGSRALGKPVGRYLSLELPADGRAGPEFVSLLGRELRTLLDCGAESGVLVVGLGNRAMTPDALGPMTADGVLVTRHLRRQLPAIFEGVRPVSALCPGVLGTTGLESAETVKSVVQTVRPDRVLAVDALAAADGARLCRVVQLTDAGIVPGSGVGNSRAAFSRESLGVPVVALGVPTVVDAAADGAGPLLVTPREIDSLMRRLSSIISAAINQALFPDWSADEIAQFVD